MFRWIFVVVGGVIVLKVAADALAEAYRAHPVMSVAIGAVVLFGAIAVAAVVLDHHDNGRRIELRRASTEYGPRVAPGAAHREDAVDHVVHHHTVRVVHEHVVEHVHRYDGGQASERRDGDVRRQVVQGEVIQRAIEGGTA